MTRKSRAKSSFPFRSFNSCPGTGRANAPLLPKSVSEISKLTRYHFCLVLSAEWLGKKSMAKIVGDEPGLGWFDSALVSQHRRGVCRVTWADPVAEQRLADPQFAVSDSGADDLLNGRTQLSRNHFAD